MGDESKASVLWAGIHDAKALRPAVQAEAAEVFTVGVGPFVDRLEKIEDALGARGFLPPPSASSTSDAGPWPSAAYLAQDGTWYLVAGGSDPKPVERYVRGSEHEMLLANERNQTRHADMCLERERKRIQSLENELAHARANTVSAASMRTEFEPGTLEAGAPVVMGHDGWVEWQGKRFVFDKDGMIERALKAEAELYRLRESTSGGMFPPIEKEIREALGAERGETTLECAKRFTANVSAMCIALDGRPGEEIVETAKRVIRERDAHEVEWKRYQSGEAEKAVRHALAAYPLESSYEAAKRVRHLLEQAIRDDVVVREALGAKEGEATSTAAKRVREELNEIGRRLVKATAILVAKENMLPT